MDLAQRTVTADFQLLPTRWLRQFDVADVRPLAGPPRPLAVEKEVDRGDQRVDDQGLDLSTRPPKG